MMLSPDKALQKFRMSLYPWRILHAPGDVMSLFRAEIWSYNLKHREAMFYWKSYHDFEMLIIFFTVKCFWVAEGGKAEE